MTHKVHGVGVRYNRRLDDDIFRTGGVMEVGCDLPTLVSNLRRNLSSRATLRYVVSGDEVWRSDLTADQLCDAVVHTRATLSAREMRRGDARHTPMPVCLCLCEDVGGGRSRASWMFRHDVIDGWRAMRFVFTCAFSECDLVLDRLPRARRPAVAQRAAAGGARAPVCQRLRGILSASSRAPRTQRLYAHIVCDLAALKRRGKDVGLRSVREVLTHAFAEAYFCAMPERRRAVRAYNAVVYDPDAVLTTTRAPPSAPSPGRTRRIRASWASTCAPARRGWRTGWSWR